MTTYDRWDVVEVPFPFIDSIQSKLRKALVLTNKKFICHERSGLPFISRFRMTKNQIKLFFVH